MARVGFIGRLRRSRGMRKFTRDKNVRIPLLIDMENVIADDFGAVSANHVFVLGSTRRLVSAPGSPSGPITVEAHAMIPSVSRPK